MATVKHNKKSPKIDFSKPTITTIIVLIGIIMLFVGWLLFMASGVVTNKKINYYTQNVRINGPFYEVFTGVFHHRFGRVWHEKQSVLGEETIFILIKQKFTAEHMLKNLNLYDQGLLPMQRQYYVSRPDPPECRLP